MTFCCVFLVAFLSLLLIWRGVAALICVRIVLRIVDRIKITYWRKRWSETEVLDMFDKANRPVSLQMKSKTRSCC